MCAGTRPCPCSSLQTLRPDLASEWDDQANAPLTVSDVSCGSGKRIAWACARCHHRWQATVLDRTHRGGSGCPACATQSARSQRKPGEMTSSVPRPELHMAPHAADSPLQAASRLLTPANAHRLHIYQMQAACTCVKITSWYAATAVATASLHCCSQWRP